MRFEPGATAVEPPAVGGATGARFRRHRRMTGLSGILLFACLFLPAVDACGAVRPYEVPPLAPPYFYGLVFAVIAMSRTSRGLFRSVIALRLLNLMVMIAGLLLALIAPQVGVPEFALGVAMMLIVGLTQISEARIAAAAVVIGAMSALWFALWCLEGCGLLGAYLSLASSAGLCLGGALWCRELALRPAVELPPAVVRSPG